MSRMQLHRGMLAAALALCALCPLAARAVSNCGTTDHPGEVGPAGCNVQFGVSREYGDVMNQPSIAVNNSGLVIEVHKAAGGTRLWYQVGQLLGTSIAWGPAYDLYLNGYWPTVALTNDGHVIVVFSDNQWRNGSELYYKVGKLDPNGGHNQTLEWVYDGGHWDGGFHTSLAVNDNGVIVGVHESNSIDPNNHELYYRLGHFTNPAENDYSIYWDSGHLGKYYDDGINPHISINDHGDVVEVHQTSGHDYLHYRRGVLVSDGISFQGSRRYNSDGVQPAVALTGNGTVVELHVHDSVLHSRMGRLDPNDASHIDFRNSEWFDTGKYPAIGTNGAWVVQAHEASATSRIFFSTSALRDRNNWMGDGLSEFGDETLSRITIPATSNSAMYVAQEDSNVGQAQSRNLYEQLQGGIRYFDLKVNGSSPQRIYNGYAQDEWGRTYMVLGPELNSVLADIKRFMDEGHKEAVVVKFSDFANFDACTEGNSAAYNQLLSSIKETLGDYLYSPNSETGNSSYPARIPLNQLLATGGKVIVVVDGNWATSACRQEPDIYAYASYQAPAAEAEAGQFNVFDQPTGTMDPEGMFNDQISKFHSFQGHMQHAPSVPCDLFMLDWTVSDLHNIEVNALIPNRDLGNMMNSVNRNARGKLPNAISVNWFQSSRVTDTAIALMDRLESSTTSPPQP